LEARPRIELVVVTLGGKGVRQSITVNVSTGI
jgi:hypothetical protein